MAALSKYINSAEVKPIYRARFAATSTTNYFVDWANQLLEELQERGFLRTTKKEAGQIVKNGIWIPLPSDLVELIKVYDPLDESAEYRVEEVNGQFKILNGFFYDRPDGPANDQNNQSDDKTWNEHYYSSPQALK